MVNHPRQKVEDSTTDLDRKPGIFGSESYITGGYNVDGQANRGAMYCSNDRKWATLRSANRVLETLDMMPCLQCATRTVLIKF
jgi:hypothetical protein